jgi:hypothetical protein
MTDNERNGEPERQLVSSTPFECDGWPLTISTFKNDEGYLVQAFLRNMPVSHTYHVDHRTYETKEQAGERPLDKLSDLAKQDLAAGLYRKWIIHWASQ